MQLIMTTASTICGCYEWVRDSDCIMLKVLWSDLLCEQLVMQKIRGAEKAVQFPKIFPVQPGTGKLQIETRSTSVAEK